MAGLSKLALIAIAMAVNSMTPEMVAGTPAYQRRVHANDPHKPNNPTKKRAKVKAARKQRKPNP